MKATTPTLKAATRQRLTARDALALNAVAEQGVITQRSLGLLLAHYGQRGQLGPRAIRAVVLRWKRLGLAETQRWFGDTLVLPTVAGAALTGNRPPSPIALAALPHTLAIAGLRPIYETRGSVTWLCESRVRAELSSGEHLPDAVVIHQESGRKIGVEAELTMKSESRIATILRQLAEQYDRTHYWAPDNVAEKVRRVAQQSLTSPELAALSIRSLDKSNTIGGQR